MLKLESSETKIGARKIFFKSHYYHQQLTLLQDADLVSSVLYFFKTFLDIQQLREDLKAWHFLGKCTDINKSTSVVVKLVYFH